MLEYLFGNNNVEKIFMYLGLHGKANATELSRAFINPRYQQMTIGLLRLCHIDPTPRPSLRLWSLVIRTAALRSGFVSLAPLVATC